MKSSLTAICLTLALSLGTISAVWSADLQKGLAAYKSGDFATALREWTPLAKQGNASAQTILGWMYEEGRGVPENDKTVMKWYTLAAKQGNANAQNNLKQIKTRLVSKGVDRCLFDEIEKVTGPETKKIVEKYCRMKMMKKSVDWLLRYAD